METNGSINADEAAAALASVTRSRARVAWGGYPVWYWLGTAACLAALPFALLLPGYWDIPVAVVIMAALVVVARVASRVRGICEGWARGAMTGANVAALYGPPSIVLIADAAAMKSVSWSPIVAAVLVFALFAGTGLALSTRAARR